MYALNTRNFEQYTHLCEDVREKRKMESKVKKKELMESLSIN